MLPDNIFPEWPEIEPPFKEWAEEQPAQDHSYPNAKYTCKHCTLKTIDEYYYCPRCGKDEQGLTEQENKANYKGVILADKDWE